MTPSEQQPNVSTVNLTTKFPLSEVGQMVTLVEKFVNLSSAERSSHGYLPFPTSFQAAENIIADKPVVSAWQGERLVAFYIADHWKLVLPEQTANSLLAIKADVCRIAGLPSDKVACGAQCVIDIPYQGSGLRQRILNSLLGTLGSRFTHLFSAIPKDNARALQAHHRDGWRDQQEDVEGQYCFVLLDTTHRVWGTGK